MKCPECGTAGERRHDTPPNALDCPNDDCPIDLFGTGTVVP